MIKKMFVCHDFDLFLGFCHLFCMFVVVVSLNVLC